MQTKTLCPNCGHENYLPMTVDANVGGVTLKPFKPALGQNPESYIAGILDKIIEKGKDAAYDVAIPAITTIIMDGVPVIPGIVVKITPKRAKVKAYGGDVPVKCPDCGMLISKGGGACSVRPLGFMSLLIKAEHRDDTFILNKLFPSGVPYTTAISRAGNVINIKTAYETGDDAPAVEGTNSDSLDAIREQAIIDGITGAENMDAAEIALERKKLVSAK